MLECPLAAINQFVKSVGRLVVLQPNCKFFNCGQGFAGRTCRLIISAFSNRDHKRYVKREMTATLYLLFAAWLCADFYCFIFCNFTVALVDRFPGRVAVFLRFMTPRKISSIFTVFSCCEFFISRTYPPLARPIVQVAILFRPW